INIVSIVIMSVVILLLILIGRSIVVKERRQNIIDNAHYNMYGAVKLVLDIITLLIAVEVAGALIYISYFYMQSGDLAYAFLHGTFLSVSATTNGGLDLYSNSLTHLEGNLFIEIPVMC